MCVAMKMIEMFRDHNTIQAGTNYRDSYISRRAPVDEARISPKMLHTSRLLICCLMVTLLMASACNADDSQPSKSKATKPVKDTRMSSVVKVVSENETNPDKDTPMTPRQVTSTGVMQQSKRPNTKPKISNAKLKKLVEQSLLKANNGTLPATKGSNFKLVFIQRATAAPSSLTSSSSTLKPSSTSTKRPAPSVSPAPKKSSGVESSGYNQYAGGRKGYSPSGKQPSRQYESLAASVSKQLASSLLYSAASFMGNLSSSAPSLSSLVAQTLAATTQHLEPSASTEASTFSILSDNLLDIKRVSSNSGSPTKGKKTGSGKTKSRPSKIYNLPVKFVSNGQPNSVMLNHIKNSFATIKKLQSATNFGAGSPSSSSSVEGGTKSKKRKQQMINRLKSKGGNSRLIYLPLKYLSNARPNRLSIVPKATHKASTN